MFSQFFGSFLLTEKLVTGQQLTKAFADKKNTRMKLGVLAINEGLMTAEQVELVHQEQARVDKRIGDLAVDMGFLKPEDVDRLLSTQPLDYLLLGQALVNDGALTNAQFEHAINTYKEKNALSDADIADDKDHKLSKLITDYYDLENKDMADTYLFYIDLLFKNLIRFIGDDFSLEPSRVISDIDAKCMASQSISGKLTCRTAIEAEPEQYLKLAGRFAEEELAVLDDFANAAVGEFLNLNNGLFMVNLSNESGVELKLEPQEYVRNEKVAYDNSAFLIPVLFSFGTVNFAISL